MVPETVSHYRVLGRLGSGGMGVVYEAEDLRLGRRVALKFLPPETESDPQALDRFQREARAASALNHPHICTIYEIDQFEGKHFIAMELLEGGPLTNSIATRPLPPARVLDIGIDIADALDAAHAKGIIHRDIKPGNVFVTLRGEAKVLDFGLAKVGPGVAPPSSQVLTASLPEYLTSPGTALGTVTYMSPEQARGETLDIRSDLFSFGAVLYEMATGAAPFKGTTSAVIFDSILNRAPTSPVRLNPEVHPELERIITKALEKDRDLRYQSASDIRSDLKRLKRDSESSRVSTAQPAVPAQPKRKPVWPYAAALAMLLAIVAAIGIGRYRTGQPAAVSHSEWEQITDFSDSATQPAFSSDGHMLTFIRGAETFITPGQIYVKVLPDGQAMQLTHDALLKMSPVFSPDGAHIDYTVLSNFNWDTYEVPITGGEPRLLLANASGLTWLDPQHLLFSEVKSGAHMGLVTSTASRSDEREVYLPPEESGMVHRSYASPDRKSVVAVEMLAPVWQRCRFLPFDGSSAAKAIGPDGRCTSAAWSPDGRWIYLSSDAGGSGFHIWRQRYADGAWEQLTSGPTEEDGIAIAPDGKSLITSVGRAQGTVWVHDEKGERQISSEGYGFAPQISPDGKTLYYLEAHRAPTTAGPELSGTGMQLVRVDLVSGASEPVLPGVAIAGFNISVDRKQVVYSSPDSNGQTHLWIASLDRRFPPRQISTGNDDTPLPLADGDIIFRSQEGTAHYVYRMKEDGSERRKLLPASVIRLLAVSPDGDWVVVWQPVEEEEARSAIQAYRLSDGSSIRICELCGVEWSANGKYLYLSYESGVRDNGLVVLPGQRTQSGGVGGVTGTYAVPLRAGAMFPTLPAKGIRSVAQLQQLGGQEISLVDNNEFEPGPLPSVYTFSRRTIQRNLYRIPLP